MVIKSAFVIIRMLPIESTNSPRKVRGFDSGDSPSGCETDRCFERPQDLKNKGQARLKMIQGLDTGTCDIVSCNKLPNLCGMLAQYSHLTCFI